MRLVAVLALTALLAGCGDTDPAARAPQAPSSTEPASTEPETSPPTISAPDFRLHLSSGAVDLKAWTACYDTGCYDGAPPADLVDVGDTDAVEFSFAREAWTFQATFREVGTGCPREITVPTEKVSSTRIRVLPTGNPGAWDVDVFGRGPGGDAITTFRWVTRSAGTYPPAASSSLAVLADHDGKLDSYGVELGVSDLASAPERASATVTVTAQNGERARIDLGRAARRCTSAGSLSWRMDESAASGATRLPGHVFEYVVRLTLDGVGYTGRGTWPTDTNKEITPAVPLSWTPALPVYRG